MTKNSLGRRTAISALLLMAGVIGLPTLTFAAEAILTDDSYTSSTSPTRNFADSASLLVGSTARSFLRFDLSSLPGGTGGSGVAKATLKLYLNKVETAGSFDVVRVNGPWAERGITDATAPPLGSLEVSRIPVALADVNSFLTVDLTALVKDWLDRMLVNNGIALVGAGGINVAFDSKENKGTSREARLEIILSVGSGRTFPSPTLDVRGSGNFTGTASVATPTAPGHAATKGYAEACTRIGSATCHADGSHQFVTSGDLERFLRLFPISCAKEQSDGA